MKELGQLNSVINALPAFTFTTITTALKPALPEHTLMTSLAGVSNATAIARPALQDSNALPATDTTQCLKLLMEDATTTHTLNLRLESQTI